MQGGFSNNINYPKGWRNNQNKKFGWNQDSGPSNKQCPFQQQQQLLYVSVPEILNKLEDALEKFMKATMASQENNITTIRNIETQVGQICKQLVDEQSGQFSANTKTNPKEHCNTMASESGRIVEKGMIIM